MNAKFNLTDDTLDSTGPQHEVEIKLDQNRGILWVNIDGVCRLRVCQIPNSAHVVFDDGDEIQHY